ncbi:MAG: sulfatase-like hydrolase/transferase [Clostridia bacterium]|nr:sulfatase-like hydrolase/transferase [Clostridia bacterium]
MKFKKTISDFFAADKSSFKTALFLSAFFYVSLIFQEAVYRSVFVKNFFSSDLVYILAFLLPLSVFLCVFAMLWRSAVLRRIIIISEFSLITLWLLIQTVYRNIFRTPLVLDSFRMAKMALSNYWRETFVGIYHSAVPIILMLLPLVFLIFITRRGITRANTKTVLGFCAAFLVLVFGSETATYVNIDKESVIGTREIYRQTFDPNLDISKFGVYTTLKLDIWQSIFGLEEVIDIQEDPPYVDPTPASSETKEDEPPKPVEKEYEPNILDIDFDKLIANEKDETLKNMHIYFSNRLPTLKNEYTGMFKGKNLIYITAEGFWKYAVNETYTPTLYKLANEGFVFENFYNPLGTHSTIDGEYAMCCGMPPSSQMFSFYKTFGNSMYFCLGNMLKDEGYITKAYHDHYADYYNRDKSHPNMGYDYYAVGRGLDMTMTWPESDLEMMQKTIPEVLAQDKPFHLYYMTVSGHLNYTFMGNMMARKHKDDVEGLDMSEEAKAYIACQMELDSALEYIIDSLIAAGQYENTVICLAGDHYPYGMSKATWNEFLGGEADENFDLPHSSLILWSGSMKEPVKVEKYCTSMDVLPTVLNLFGLDYDSRLLMGRDILSDSEGTAIMYNMNFINKYGRFTVSDNKFILNDGYSVPSGYASNILAEIKKTFSYADKVLLYDYYRVLGLVH